MSRLLELLQIGTPPIGVTLLLLTDKGFWYLGTTERSNSAEFPTLLNDDTGVGYLVKPEDRWLVLPEPYTQTNEPA